MNETKEVEVLTKCCDCSKEISMEEVKTHDDCHYCESCWDLNIGFCECCEKSVLMDDLQQIKEKWYCSECVAEKFKRCHECGQYVEEEHVVYSEIHEADYCSNCVSICLRYCSECGYEINGDTCYCGDDGDSYCDNCWESHEHEEDDEEDYIQNLELSGTSFTRCSSSRKFGVEIEACLADVSAQHLSMDRVGTWSSQHDGSLGDGGREYASAILQGDEGFQEIEMFTEKLRSWGYVIQKSCGLHVHIDGRDLGYEDIRKLLKIVLTYEPVIYAMLPGTRYTGSFSVPLSKFPKTRFRRKVKDENDLKAVWYGREQNHVNLTSKYHHSRYYGVNIHSWFFRRSIEFRYHSGTLNPVKITNFVKICQAMVDKAKAIKTAKVRSFQSFREQYESFVSFLGFPPGLAIYIKQRVLKFNPACFGHTPVLAQ